MEIEASVANRLIMKLGGDDIWDVDDFTPEGTIFYHKYSGTCWRLTYEGPWAEWLAGQVSICPSCDQSMMVHFPLQRMRKVPYTGYRWKIHAES